MIRFTPVILALLFAPMFASAATLYLSPASGSYTVGKPFTVNVFVESSDEPMNAVSGTISIPSDMFTVTSASAVGSVVNFWVQQPQVSGSSISFEGVVLNPGYEGSGAKVASFVLVPKKTGSGSISFASASVLANDGEGSAILDRATGAQYSVQEAAVPAPTPTPAAAPAKSEAPPAPVETKGDTVEAPRIVDYDAQIGYQDLVAIRGVTYESANVEVLIYKDGVVYASETGDSNSSGEFSIIIPKRLPPGTYEVSLRVTLEDGTVSDESVRYPLTIGTDFVSLLTEAAGSGLGIVSVIALALVALLAVLHAYGWHRLFALSREVRATHADAADMTRKVFTLLKKDVAAHVKKIQAAGQDRVLTDEEVAFLKDFADELSEAETAITKGKKKR